MVTNTPISCLLPKPVARAAMERAPSRASWDVNGEVFTSTTELLEGLPQTGPEGVPAQLRFKHRLGFGRTWKSIVASPVRTVESLFKRCNRFESASWRFFCKTHVIYFAPIIGLAGLAMSLISNSGSHYRGEVDGVILKNDERAEFIYQTQSSGEKTLHSLPLGGFSAADTSKIEPDGQWWSPAANHAPYTDPEQSCPGQVDQVLKAALASERLDAAHRIDFEEDYLLVSDIPLEIH